MRVTTEYRYRHPTFFIRARAVQPHRREIHKKILAAIGKVNSTSLSRLCLVTMVGDQEENSQKARTKISVEFILPVKSSCVNSCTVPASAECVHKPLQSVPFKVWSVLFLLFSPFSRLEFPFYYSIGEGGEELNEVSANKAHTHSSPNFPELFYFEMAHAH